MSNDIMQEKKSTLPEGFAKWAKKYFGKKAEEEVTLDLGSLFDNEYLRIRESLRTQLKNAEKLPEFATQYAARLKKIDDDQNIKDLQAIVKELRELVAERREKVAAKIEKLHGDALFEQLDLKRDPNEARETVNAFLKTWDIAEAERECNLFEQQLKRAKSMNPGDLKSLEKRHEEAGLQNAQYARNTQQAKAIATRLIGPDGKIILQADRVDVFEEMGFVHTDDLPMLMHEIQTGDHKDLPQSEHALAMLSKLKNDKGLRDQLEAMVKPPDQTSVAAQLIRDTLGLEPGTEVTDVHTRQAALSGLLYQTRQGDVGSCFATAIACSTQRNEPKTFLKDMSDLFATGELTRTTIDGTAGRKTIKIKLNKDAVKGTLEKKTGVSRKDSNLHLAPDMVGAMNALKIAPDEQKKALEAAAREIRAEKALDEALGSASIPDAYFGVGNEREKVRKDVIDALRKDSTLTIKQALKDVFAARNMTLTTGTGTAATRAGGLRKSAALAKCNPYDADGTDQLKPEELIEKMVKMRLPENEQKAAIKASRDAFLAQQDNLLLRAYEYTIATATDQIDEVSSTKYLLNWGASQQGGDFLSNEINNNGSWNGASKSAMQGFKTQLLAEFDKVLKNKTESRYNPSVKKRTDVTASDGHSSSGGFSMYYKDKEITSESEYKTMMEELLREAQNTVVPTQHPWVQARAPALVDKLIAEYGKATFQEKIVDKLVNVVSSDRNNLVKPWANATGGEPRNILQVTRNLDAPPQETKSPSGTDNAEKLGKFIAKTMKDMKVDKQLAAGSGVENSSITVSTKGLHAFNLLPGSPKLLAILKEFDDPNEGLDKYKENEKKKQTTRSHGEVPLTDPPTGQVKSMIDAALLIFEKTDHAKIIKAISEDLKKMKQDKIAIAHADAKIAKQVKYWLQTIYPTLTSAEVDDWCKKSKTKTAAQISQAIVSEMEFEPLLEMCLERLKVPEDKAKLIREELTKTLKGKRSMERSELTKAIQAELLKQQAGGDLGKIEAAMKEPPGIVFADYNWGAGDHRILGSMVVNPVTGEFELWQMNEDGSEAGPMDQDKWIKDTEWQVFSDTKQFGGIVGNPAVEKKRGEQQEKLEQCLKAGVGDVRWMNTMLETADERIAQGKFDLADVTLTKLEGLTKEALKLAANIKQVDTELAAFVVELKKTNTPALKSAVKQVESLIADVKYASSPADVDKLLERQKKLCAILKDGTPAIGIAVDVAQILKQTA